MTIPIEREPEAMRNQPPEQCHFCDCATRFWHINTNNPVCPDCAPKHKVSELPDFGQRVRAQKRKERLQRQKLGA